jgi:hypothetical protein
MVDFGDLRLFARPDPVPRSLIVFGGTLVPNEAAGLDRMAKSDFDSNREVVLETPQSSVLSPQSSRADPVPVQPDVARAERWHAHVSLAKAGYLLQREAWYPGWRARVDGNDTPVLRADVLYRAVALGPGEHDVEIFFDSATFNRGALLSLGGLVIVVILLTWRWLPIMRTSVRE